jgi:hypothetical protein
MGSRSSSVVSSVLSFGRVAVSVLSTGRDASGRGDTRTTPASTIRHQQSNASQKVGVALAKVIRAGAVVAHPYCTFTFFPRGPDVSSTQRVVLSLAAAFTIAATAQAQIAYPFPPYRYPNFAPDASVRLEVKPTDAEVYVDGYYAGVVDDFDGMWQRLRVEPGQHEITLYREGYRSVHERVYLARDRTFKIMRQLEPLPAGEAGEPRPTPIPAPAGAQGPRPLPRDGRGAPPNPPPPSNPPADGAIATGTLTIQVDPSDANVAIDGQPWPLTPGQNTVVVDLSAGRHVVQVRKPGFVGYLTEVDVRRGENTSLNVTLRTQP